MLRWTLRCSRFYSKDGAKTQKVGKGLRQVGRAGVVMRECHYHDKEASPERHNLNFTHCVYF